MDSVRQVADRKQKTLLPIHLILVTNPAAFSALRALKPELPEDPVSGVLYAVGTSRQATAEAAGIYGPDGKPTGMQLPELLTAEAKTLGSRLPRPDQELGKSAVMAWFMAEGFDYGKLGGLRDKTGMTSIADLQTAAKAELALRQTALGEAANADIVRYNGQLRLSTHLERFALTKDLGKELAAALKLRAADKTFANEIAAFKGVHAVDASLASQRKPDLEKVKGTYQGIATKYPETLYGKYAAALIEAFKPLPKK